MNSSFSVAELPVEEYALSIGLFTLPRLRFFKRGAEELQPATGEMHPVPDHHRCRPASVIADNCRVQGG